MSTKIILKVLSGPIEGQTFVFDRHDTLLFGRRKDCHARIADDEQVSRHHFLLEANPPEARIRDLGSRNGTYVNGTKYGGRQRGERPAQDVVQEHPEVDLKSGDVIAVGRTTILVKVELPPPKPELDAPRCGLCGKDVATEVHERSQGEYICRACQGDLLGNTPDLRQLFQRAARKKPGAAAPDIAGYEVGELLGKGGMGPCTRGGASATERRWRSR